MTAIPPGRLAVHFDALEPELAAHGDAYIANPVLIGQLFQNDFLTEPGAVPKCFAGPRGSTIIAEVIRPQTLFENGDGIVRIRKLAAFMPVPRELLYETPPTAEEVEQRRAECEATEARQATRHAELLASPSPVVRAVAGLHSPDDYRECQGCDGSGDGLDPEWPCRTWTLLDETETP